jgi:lipopolysaccharide transport system ATP-binding protein
MSDVALRMDRVYKKFRKGEVYNSLRDLIPALTGRMLRQSDLRTRDAREFWALQDISFEVMRGEAFALIGHNGAGKSTLLKLLSRVMNPTRGHMVVNGRLSALIDVGAGFHQDLTGRENIFLNGTILGMSRREIASKLDEIIAFSGIEEFIDTPVKRYSSGMYARLGFSVASHVDPEVLVVDEVLSVGDYVFQQKCIDRMRTVMRSGVTVLFVSHNLKAVTELCQRSLLLAHGKMVMIGPSDAVVRRYLVDVMKEPTAAEKSLYVSQVVLRSAKGEQSSFESGDVVWVDVEVTARHAASRLAVVLWFTDEKDNLIFDTSTERLGHAPFSLGMGQRQRCTFELTLNMAHGAFRLCVALYRYDTQTEYDRRAPALTLFVGTSLAVRGAVNCFPKVVELVAVN